MNILDYMDEENNIILTPKELHEPPVLLAIGETVYKVIRGDVYEMYVYDENSWLCGEGRERGYRLKSHDGGYSCCWNRSINFDVFLDKEKAITTAEKYLMQNDCIRSKDIIPIKTVSYRYIREADNREMIAFYSELTNGLLYIKKFMEYEHICENTKKNIKDFLEQRELNYAKQFDYILIPKNMYRCKDKTDLWKYCEARCTK